MLLEWLVSFAVVHVGRFLAYVALPHLLKLNFAAAWKAQEPSWGRDALHHSQERDSRLMAQEEVQVSVLGQVRLGDLELAWARAVDQVQVEVGVDV